jgi:hypothetical protein
MSEKHKKTENWTFTIPSQRNEEFSGISGIRHKVVKNMNERISALNWNSGRRKKSLDFLVVSLEITKVYCL